ncbi:aldose 1-epimerase [Lachnotalea glycerini]|uniref:Aldose 1-epimerase n=1 Tax=Lachnotalea glycerini TaxID=1763509 RepID=A0A255IA08_9FIRM|nr:aldose epimerase family protein [Lachnotalea glycerini]PXV84755.1 aldose 1-epimerase [Lachnotalea glycerini]RDY30831.1 galactose mutarotase [Lachnotalea glycerini]
MSISKTNYGKTTKGDEIFQYAIENKNGMKACFINYGAIMTKLIVPDKNGKFADVVHGYDTLQGYESNPCYFGATIGRNGNRIAKGQFEINGIRYQLDTNEGVNNLHGGLDGYNKRIWSAKENEQENEIVFSLSSPDGDQGFPGHFKVAVTYKLTDDNELQIIYDGVSDKDTVANMTNHSYFNLTGHTNDSILDHILWIKASKFVPVVDSASIPTGEILSVKGTPMDFTEPKAVGKEIESDFEQLKFTGGYDHNYALDRDGKGIEKIAEVKDPKSGRIMQVFTDLPGVQLYVGNFINTNGESGKDGMKYQKRSALCLETQYFPDAINQDNFESPILKAGAKYHTTTIYKFIS